jgi:hypothetical protein
MAAAFRQHRQAQNNDMGNLLAAALNQQAPAQNTSLKAADVGYFDPSAKDPSGAGVISDGKANKYTDIFPFCDRLAHLAATHGDEAVRRVWSQCLQGPALVWHSHILTDDDRELLRTATVAAICNKLKNRFKIDYSEALDTLKQSRFTLYDVANGKDLMAFIQTMMRNAKACDMSRHGQLIAAFEALDGDIQSELDKPTATTEVDTFLRQVQDRESVLRRRAQRYQRPPPRQQYPPQRPYQPQHANRGQHYGARGNYQNYGNRQWQNNRQPFQPNHQQNAPWQPARQPQQQPQPAWHGNQQQFNGNQANAQKPFNQQQPQQVIPENRRLPAPPQRNQWQQAGKPVPAFHGSTSYQPPAVEDAQDEEFNHDDFGNSESYYGEQPIMRPRKQATAAVQWSVRRAQACWGHGPSPSRSHAAGLGVSTGEADKLRRIRPPPPPAWESVPAERTSYAEYTSPTAAAPLALFPSR